MRRKKMSDIDFGEQKEREWENWLDENEYKYIGGEFWECAGGHAWHVSDIIKLFEESKNE